MKKVLVTDCNSRKALCVVRSLGKQGFHVVAASDEKVNMSRFSKYCSEYRYLPNPTKDEKCYIEIIVSILEKDDIDILIPMEDETVELIIKNKELFKKVHSLLPDYKTFMIARDKGKTIKKALEYGVPCPKTYFVNSYEDLEHIKKDILLPVIIKPRISSGSRGLIHVNNIMDLIDRYKEIQKSYPSLIIQEYLSGDYIKIQVLVMLDKNHKVRASCTYQGIREFPVNGGPVTLWKTVSYPLLEEITVRFMENLKWVGFAEVEYLVNPNTGEYYLMEINPRFSANIALAVHVGVDFPLLFTKMALEQEVPIVRNNKLNTYCQWLLPGDILNFIFNKNRFKQEIGYFIGKPKNMCYAILSKDDPLPVMAAIISIFKNFAGNIKNLKYKLKADRL